VHGLAHRLDGGVADRVLPHHHAGRDLAAADARRVQHSRVLAQRAGQSLQQIACIGKLAGDRVAHPHGEGRRHALAFLHHVEVVVEGCYLVHLGLRQPHLLRERREVCRRQVAVAVVDLVQVLDQQVAAPRLFPEQRAHLLEGPGVDWPALRVRPDLALAFHRHAPLSTKQASGVLFRVRSLDR
jgi:hypothetical protein